MLPPSITEKEGLCQGPPNGQEFVVANSGSILHLKELDAQLLGIDYRDTTGNSGIGTSNAHGTFMVATLKITNELNRPVTFDDSQSQTIFTVGSSHVDVYTESFDAENNPRNQVIRVEQ